MISKFAVSIGAVLSLLAAPALAETKRVMFDDLDLDSPAGAKELDRRINAAARDVCGAADVRTGSRIAMRASKSCIQNARASARKQVAGAIAESPPVGG